MPIYSFDCTDCEHKDNYFIHSYNSPNPKCGLCGSDTKKTNKFFTTLIDMNGICTATEAHKRDLWSNGAKIV
jgi:putative FmdB family regulatory protein